MSERAGETTLTVEEQAERTALWDDVTRQYRLAALERENARLYLALHKYGRHESRCAYKWGDEARTCDCGLSKALTLPNATEEASQ